MLCRSAVCSYITLMVKSIHELPFQQVFTDDVCVSADRGDATCAAAAAARAACAHARRWRSQATALVRVQAGTVPKAPSGERKVRVYRTPTCNGRLPQPVPARFYGATQCASIHDTSDAYVDLVMCQPKSCVILGGHNPPPPPPHTAHRVSHNITCSASLSSSTSAKHLSSDSAGEWWRSCSGT